MGTNEKNYFWLRLKRDFFKRHDIRILGNMDDGDSVVLCYLKLLTESVDHDGYLRFSDDVAYTPEMLASVTDTDPDIMETTIKTLCSFGMMRVEDDGSYYMTKVEKMIGSLATDEHSREMSRLRVQKFREGKKQEQEELKRYTKRDSNVTVTPSETLQKHHENVKCNGEIEKEIDIEKDIKKESKKKEKSPCQLIADKFNETCVSFPRIVSLSDARVKAINARLKKYTIEDVFKVFEKAEASSFLKGSNNRDWSATFDWIMSDKNFAKILDGNYDDKDHPVRTDQKGSGDQLGSFYAMAAKWAEDHPLKGGTDDE